MKIDAKYQPWRTATSDMVRPLLSCLYVEREGLGGSPTITAADGFMLTCVPCELGEDDLDGLIGATALNAILKMATKYLPKKYPVEIAISERQLGFGRPDAGLHFAVPRYLPAPDAPAGEWPNYRAIVNQAMEQANTDAPERIEVSFNPDRMRICGESIGAIDGVWLIGGHTPTAATRPLILGPLGLEFGSDGLPIPPFSVLMPMQASKKWRSA